MSEKTTIWVGKDIAEEIKKYGDTADGAIRRLLNMVETAVGKKHVQSKQIDLSLNVSASTGYTRMENYKEAPFDGTITQIVLHFPPGCNGLVQVRVGVDQTELTDWIALDDTTQNLRASFHVKQGDRIWAEIFNYDSEYSHKIGVVVTLIG